MNTQGGHTGMAGNKGRPPAEWMEGAHLCPSAVSNDVTEMHLTPHTAALPEGLFRGIQCLHTSTPPSPRLAQGISSSPGEARAHQQSRPSPQPRRAPSAVRLAVGPALHVSHRQAGAARGLVSGSLACTSPSQSGHRAHQSLPPLPPRRPSDVFIHSSAGRCLRCFHVLATMNNAAVATHVHVFEWTCVTSLEHIPWRGMAESRDNSMLDFLSNCQAVFQSSLSIYF